MFFIEVSVSSSEGSKKMDIADVSFEEEDDALDEFLGSTDVTPLNENLPGKKCRTCH
jgi:hypothetical protein